MGIKEPKVIMLTLETIDYCMDKCSHPLHIQVCSKEFMNALVMLLNLKGLPPQVRFCSRLIWLSDLTESPHDDLKMGHPIRQRQRHLATFLASLSSSQAKRHYIP
jgi:hypothetical protein